MSARLVPRMARGFLIGAGILSAACTMAPNSNAATPRAHVAPAPEPVQLAGVVYVDGKVAGAGTLHFSSREQFQAAAVGADGAYSVTLARSGPCNVRFQTTGGERIYPRKTFEATADARQDFRFETLLFRGRVVTPDGTPIRWRRGILFGRETVKFLTEPDGSIELYELAPGSYTWKFNVPPRGVYPPCATFEAGAAAEQLCRLQPGTPLEIRFTGELRSPVLRAYYFVGDNTRRELTITSGLRENVDRIQVIWPVDAAAGIIEADDSLCAYFKVAPQQKALEIALSRCGSIDVALLDGAGLPLQHYPYRVARANQDKMIDFVPVLATDARGHGVAFLPASTYEVEVTFPEGARVVRSVTIPHDGYQLIEIREGAP